jgi:uncharacterized protein YutE (UPF0331/DUF86 family)
MLSAEGSRKAPLVDGETISARLERLEHFLERLEAVHDAGEDAYLGDADVRAMSERLLHLSIQVCIDVGAQLAAELSVEAPADYASVFTNLAASGHLDPGLADRLAAAARQRNLLIHLYLDIDDREVFSSLGRLDDLRSFAEVVQRFADESG